MTLQQLIDFTRRVTRTNATTYTDADITQDLNLAQGKVISRILQKQTSFDFQGQIAYANIKNYEGVLEGDQGYQGMYKFPADLLKIVRLEVAFTTGGVSTLLKERDITSPQRELDDTLSQFYSVFAGTIRISPKPTEDVYNGMKIFYEKRAADLVEMDDKPVYEETFHNILPLEASREYFSYDPTEANVYRKNSVEQKLAEEYSRLDQYYATKENRNYKITPKYTNYGS